MLAALGIAGVLAAVSAVGAADASASTIPNGHIQICAQGSYPAFIHVLSKNLGNGLSTGTFSSAVESPNEGSSSCWWTQFDTHGQSVQVDVVGLDSNGNQFYIGSRWWNSSTGLGIGAEGSSSSPWIETW